MEKLKNYPSLKRGMCVFAVSVGMLSFAFVDDLFLVSKNLDIFASVYKEINLSYVDEVNTSKLMKTGIDAMLNELDPYTQYVPIKICEFGVRWHWGENWNSEWKGIYK